MHEEKESVKEPSRTSLYVREGFFVRDTYREHS